jgi:alkylation response protein AidB-like acyl-CoA dehydrogenase
VRVPKSALLYDENRGFTVAMTTLNGGRIGVAAQAVGIARSAFDDSFKYSQERRAFGKRVCEHQSIQNYFADMICHIDSARYLTLDAAKRKDQGKQYVRHAAMAKLFASETAMMSAVKGIQIHGGYGYVTDYPAERHLRDAKITEIYEGTSEIQRILIATQLLKE